MASLLEGINWQGVAVSLVGTAALPTWWNIVARNEYNNHTMEKIFGKYPGAYVLAVWIFVFSLGRDWCYEYALRTNEKMYIADPESSDPIWGAAMVERLYFAGCALFAVGTFLVVTSFARLGITGTYLGDYFGILMKARVTAFPFSVLENPMYVGATMNFLAMAMMWNCWVGIPLSAWIWTVYQISCIHFENPFTGMIYEKAAQEAKKKGK